MEFIYVKVNKETKSVYSVDLVRRLKTGFLSTSVINAVAQDDSVVSMTNKICVNGYVSFEVTSLVGGWPPGGVICISEVTKRRMDFSGQKGQRKN